MSENHSQPGAAGTRRRGDAEIPPLTARQLEILQHSLGVDEYGMGQIYRNHFCAGGDDEETCRELIALGYMQQHRTTDWLPYFNCLVTNKGKRAVLAESPRPPKLTRSQRRYRAFLNADTGESFSEWIKREARS
jgi:hypothetical protein